jgi:hypothetical protein
MNIDQAFDEAWKLTEQGKAEEAISLYERIIEHRPDIHHAWYNRGILLEQSGRIDEAIRSYEGAVIAKPNLFWAIHNLAILNERLGRHRDANFWLTKRISFGYFKNEFEERFLRMACDRSRAPASDDPGTLFVSYPWIAREKVEADIIPVLDRIGVTYFFDSRDMPQKGEMGELPWRLELGLARCGAILLVWCVSAKRSHWMNLEVVSAVAMLKNVFVVTLDETPVPSFLKHGIRHGLVRVLELKELSELRGSATLLERPLDALALEAENRFCKTESLDLGGVKMELVKLSGGLLEDIFVAVCPTTQEQWIAVLGDNPSKHVGDETRPVESVSWSDANQFIEALNARVPNEFRLMSDVEWEFACRTGSTANWSFGDDEDQVLQNAWCVDNTRIGTEPSVMLGQGHEEGMPSKMIEVETSPHAVNSVFTKKPNHWGLRHMHGNVAEWCEDGTADGRRLVRGGSFKCYPRNLRCAARSYLKAEEQHDDVGFRVCATAS